MGTFVLLDVVSLLFRGETQPLQSQVEVGHLGRLLVSDSLLLNSHGYLQALLLLLNIRCQLSPGQESKQAAVAGGMVWV